VQNIAEGSMASATSKKSELKLTGVARASLEELLLDYEDFLRQRGLQIWLKDSPEALAVRGKYRSDRSDQSDRSDRSDKSDPYNIATASAEAAANTIICLINQASFLLGRQLHRLEQMFLEEGGFTERLYRERTRSRRNLPTIPIKIKICGMTCGEDALAALEAGADFIGLIFYKKSPRFVTLEQAEGILSFVREHGFDAPRAIGVFVNEEPQIVLEYVNRLGLYAAQIHGDESPDYFSRLAHCRIIRTIRIKGAENLEALGRGDAWAWLCDAWHPEHYGGTGKRVDVALLAPYVSKHRIIIAGGLTPKNVSEVIRAVNPYGVDVSSGVESAPGKKDHEKIRGFIRAVRSLEI
jgi:phosphoribosylanthranilate isomerase